MSREIEVWADWQELSAPILMGHLRFSLILREVKDAVGTWKKHASDLGIARTEQEIMAAAFEA